jgi:hypothetical protein
MYPPVASLVPLPLLLTPAKARAKGRGRARVVVVVQDSTTPPLAFAPVEGVAFQPGHPSKTPCNTLIFIRI